MSNFDSKPLFSKEEMEISRLEEQMYKLLLKMELHFAEDSPSDFSKWWIEEGRRERYFSLKRQKEVLEERLYRMKMIQHFDRCAE